MEDDRLGKPSPPLYFSTLSGSNILLQVIKVRAQCPMLCPRGLCWYSWSMVCGWGPCLVYPLLMWGWSGSVRLAGCVGLADSLTMRKMESSILCLSSPPVKGPALALSPHPANQSAYLPVSHHPHTLHQSAVATVLRLNTVTRSCSSVQVPLMMQGERRV